METGVETRPFVILTSERDLEEQMKEEWRMVRGFYSLLQITSHTTRKTERIEPFFNTWLSDLDCFWVRRTTSAQNREKFIRVLDESYRANRQLLITADEADKGIGAPNKRNGNPSLISQWFSEIIPSVGMSLYDCLNGNANGGKPVQHFKLFNYSATLGAYLMLDNALNCDVPPESMYRHWRDVNRFTIKQYAVRYNCPELIYLGETCSPQHSAYGETEYSIKNFVRLRYTKDGDRVVVRGPLESQHPWKKKELEELCENPDVVSAWHHFKEEEVPTYFADFVRNRLLEDNADEKNGIVCRFVLNNRLTADLIKRLRKIIPESEMIFIPLTTKPDAFNDADGKPITYSFKKDKDAREAIFNAYKLRGLSPFEVPCVVFVTNTARRGTKLLDGFVQIEFTKDPTSKTSSSQANGRCGGFKENTELVVSDIHEEVVTEKKKKPYSPHTHGSPGRPRTTEYVWRSRAEKQGHGDKFEWIDRNILNTPILLDTIRQQERKRPGSGKLRGGDALLTNGLPTVGNIAEVITPEFLLEIAEFQDQYFHPKCEPEAPTCVSKFAVSGHVGIVGNTMTEILIQQRISLKKD